MEQLEAKKKDHFSSKDPLRLGHSMLASCQFGAMDLLGLSMDVFCLP